MDFLGASVLTNIPYRLSKIQKNYDIILYCCCQHLSALFLPLLVFQFYEESLTLDLAALTWQCVYNQMSASAGERRTTRSPYFPIRKVTAKETSSPYFRRRYVCPVASAQALGPLVLCLSTTNDSPLCLQSPASSAFAAPCDSCRGLITEPRAHFRNCSIFEKRWQQYGTKGDIKKDQSSSNCSTPEPCWVNAERRLHFSVRHLCTSNCYMRAYAPYRAFHTVRSSTAPLAYGERASAAFGWRCRLVLPPAEHTESSAYAAANSTLKSLRNKRRRTGTTSNRSLLPRLFFASEDGDHSHSEKVLIHKIRVRKQHERICTNLFPTHDAESNKLQELPGRHLDLQTLQCHPLETPYGLLEELFYDDVWKLLLSAIFLNRTTRKQVDSVLFAFLQQWPSPEAVLAAAPSSIANVIQPLGMHHRRTAGILRFTQQYTDLLHNKPMHRLERNDILGLYNCGEYACDVYQLFVKCDCSIEPTDSMLKVYAKYQRSQRSPESE